MVSVPIYSNLFYDVPIYSNLFYDVIGFNYTGIYCSTMMSPYL